MNPGKTERIIEIEPLRLPAPLVLPVPAPAPVPAEPARVPVPELVPADECGSCGADIGPSTSFPWHYDHEDCRAIRQPVPA